MKNIVFLFIAQFALMSSVFAQSVHEVLPKGQLSGWWSEVGKTNLQGHRNGKLFLEISPGSMKNPIRGVFWMDNSISCPQFKERRYFEDGRLSGSDFQASVFPPRICAIKRPDLYSQDQPMLIVMRFKKENGKWIGEGVLVRHVVNENGKSKGTWELSARVEGVQKDE
jgi:hypothetical protein